MVSICTGDSEQPFMHKTALDSYHSAPLSGRVIGLEGAFSKDLRQNAFDPLGAEHVCHLQPTRRKRLQRQALTRRVE
jgi:hypothetical protein